MICLIGLDEDEDINSEGCLSDSASISTKYATPEKDEGDDRVTDAGDTTPTIEEDQPSHPSDASFVEESDGDMGSDNMTSGRGVVEMEQIIPTSGKLYYSFPAPRRRLTALLSC